MFVIGILSSPIPYILVSFIYLLGLSYGIFSSYDKGQPAEELCSNIINYEELIPVTEEISDHADYFSFYKTTTDKQNIHYSEVLKMFFRKELITAFQIENTEHYNYILNTDLSNRPPPLVA